MIIYATQQQARADNLITCCHETQIDIRFSCVYHVLDDEFRHNIVKVVYKYTWLSPHGSTATLTVLDLNLLL